MNPEELALRDIHLPAPVGWWPPAPGWWLLAGLMLAVIIWLFWRWQQQRRSEQGLELALSELERLQGMHGKNTKELLQELFARVDRLPKE